MSIRECGVTLKRRLRILSRRAVAALNVLDGTVIGRNMHRHGHQKFIRFLNAVESQVPPRKAIHAMQGSAGRGDANGQRLPALSLLTLLGKWPWVKNLSPLSSVVDPQVSLLSQ